MGFVRLVAVGDVGHGAQGRGVCIFRVEPQMPVPGAGHAFGAVELHETGTGNAIEDAPYFRVLIRGDVRRCGLAAGPPVQIKAQPVAAHPPGPPLQRRHAPSFAECAVVHVRAEGEIPHLFAGPPDKPQPV